LAKAKCLGFGENPKWIEGLTGFKFLICSRWRCQPVRRLSTARETSFQGPTTSAFSFDLAKSSLQQRGMFQVPHLQSMAMPAVMVLESYRPRRHHRHVPQSRVPTQRPVRRLSTARETSFQGPTTSAFSFDLAKSSKVDRGSDGFQVPHLQSMAMPAVMVLESYRPRRHHSWRGFRYRHLWAVPYPTSSQAPFNS
jgi:hypothetical protein